MLKKPSLITRIAIGKLTGFSIALIGAVILRLMIPEFPLMFCVGIVLWYATLGAMIGVFGIFTHHPIFKFRLPWWLRSSIIGAWMNFVLTLIAYDKLQEIIILVMGHDSFLRSPFWFVAEGIAMGLIIGYFVTKFGGEGKETIDKSI